MTIKTLFFDSVAGDRVYTSEDWEEVLGTLLTDGIRSNFGNEYEVIPSTPEAMSVVARSGTALVNSKIVESDADETLTVDGNTSGSTRIDRAIVFVDYSTRTGGVTVKKGTPGAGAPTLQRDSSRWEISLAQVTVADGAVSISASDIQDERSNPTVAGVSNVRGATPAGTIAQFGGASAPDGWFLCRGQAVSRTDYDRLFAAIGTTYGAGDGSTTFNLPNLQQRFPLGKAAAGTGSTLGGVGGAIDHAHTNPESASAGGHSHTNPNTSSTGSHAHTNPNTSSGGSHSHGDTFSVGSETTGDGSGPSAGSAGGGHYHVLSGGVSSGGSHSHSQGNTGSNGNHSHTVGNTSTVGGHTHAQGDTGTSNPPFLVVNFIIKH